MTMIPSTNSLRAPEDWRGRLTYNLKAAANGALNWLRIALHRPTPYERQSAKEGTGWLSPLTGPIGFLPAAFVADALEILVAWEAEVSRGALMRGRRLGLPYKLQQRLLQSARAVGSGDWATLIIPTGAGVWLECYIVLGDRSYPNVAGLIWRSWPGRRRSLISGGFISTPFGKVYYCRRDLTRPPEPQDVQDALPR